MSNNQLADNDKVKYVPKLRFTEFKNDDGWKLKKLSAFGKTVSGLTYSPNDIRNEGLLVLRSSNVQDGKISLEDCVFVDPNIKGVNLTEENDILICVRNGSTSLIGKNALIPKDMPLCTHGAFMTVFRSKNYQFVFQLLQTNLYKTQVANDLGARINSINTGNLLNYDFFVPSLPEQQKISSCFSSLDELIQNESSKLEAYKQHKDGLLQQLFPRNGESLPTLRFDEFCEEWENIELSKIAKPIKKKNRDHDKILVLSLSNEYGLVSQVDYFQKKIAGENTDKYIVLQKNDFVYNDRITKNSTYGTIKRLSLYDEGIVSPIYKCFRFEKNQNPVFWEYFFESKSHENEIRQIINEGARAGRYNISTDSFLSINVTLPSHLEQEKIASCLTLLDETITSQNNYIEYLKTHKKGLMQQLFPVLEDISA